MSNSTSHIKEIPLEQLFQRLELAGFKLSPADRLRAIRILSGPGKKELESPEKLKDILAPLLARSAEDQLKFYEIFDHYFQEISTLSAAEETRTAWPWWTRYLIVIPLLLTLLGGYYQFWQETPIPNELVVTIEGPGSGAVGDTITFFNQSHYTGDSSELKWRWSFHDLSKQDAQFSDSVNYHFPVIIPTLDDGSFLREIRLEVYTPEDDSIYQTRHAFKVVCLDQPDVGGIKIRESNIEAGQNVNFSTINTLPTVQAGGQQKLSDSAANWHFQWDYGDGESLEGSFYAVHKYERNGQYQVKLTVTDTSSQAFCSEEHLLDIKVGQDQAYLPVAKLYPDSSEVLAVWSWGYYLLLGGLGLALLYYWLRWLVNRPDDDKQRKEKNKDEALYARFKHSDKGPYYIPFRDQDQSIQTCTGQLRLADAMRLRQDGLRREINIKETLKATLNQGGFPQARFSYASQASEYLILVDEQKQASHLGHLFKYLAKSLQGEDVNIDIYYYHKHFTRFWNSYFPQGLDLDQLHRSHGHYKLIVMGDLHEMIDPFSRNKPSLRPVLANVLRQWGQRILLTPTSPVSWTYREKLLARIFSVFPADTAGLNRMATHLQNGEELLPDGAAFDRWKELQTETRHDEDTEYRKWKRWRYIRDYFNGCHEDVERWFKALAVFPSPSWPITLAIGRALGIQITYDKLLQLARIPVLQVERFDEKLRQELLSTLDSQDEKLARQALQEELAAVKTITAGSHAMQELETCIAMQTFALEPLKEKSRDAIRFLLKENLLTKAQEIELDRVTDSHLNTFAKQAPLQKQKTVKKQAKQPKRSVRQWLQEDSSPLTPSSSAVNAKKRKKHLRKAILYTLAYLALLAFGWKMGGTAHLYKAVFGKGQEKRMLNHEQPLRDYVLVKEVAVVDSAIIYNNQGVEHAVTATASDTLAIPYFEMALEQANILIHGKNAQFNGQAISYALANSNRAKVFYNSAVSYFNLYQKDSLGQTILPEALDLLTQAYKSDSIALDVLHARAVIHYYLGSPEDTIYQDYQLLDSLGYFNQIDYTPNLKTLSGYSRSIINDISIQPGPQQSLNLTINYFINQAVDKEVEMLITSIGQGNQPDDQIEALTNGTGSVRVQLSSSGQGRQDQLREINVQLRRVSDHSIIDTKTENYKHNWAPQKSVGEAPIKETPPQNSSGATVKESFRIRGQVMDPLTRKPIAGALIELKEQATRANGKLINQSTTTDDYGEFQIEGAFQRVGPSNVAISVFKDGYQDQREVYTKQQLISFNPKESILLEMSREVAYPQMRGISGGDFTMGTNEYGYPTDPSSAPSHQVTVSSFSISTYEITFTQYDHFCEATQREKPDDYNWGRGNRPVINVSWYDAIAFCNWLSQQAGYEPAYEIIMGKGQIQSVTYIASSNGYRLPTEAEWEYAAMGGPMKNVSQVYAGSGDLNEVGWYDGNSINQTHGVGQKKPNNAGLYDMSGNVWEWCTDVYSDYPSTPQTNPAVGPPGSHRIIRGGAWIQGKDDCRVKVRQYRFPDKREVITGFRIARSGR